MSTSYTTLVSTSISCTNIVVYIVYNIVHDIGYDMGCNKGALHLYYLHIQSLFPAAAMAIMMRSPAPLTPTCKTETLGCSSGLFPGPWVVSGPVGRYRARGPLQGP